MLEYVILAVASVAAIIGILNLIKRPARPDTSDIERKISDEMRLARQESNTSMAEAVRNAAQTQAETQRQIAERQDATLASMTQQLSQRQTLFQQAVSEQMGGMDRRLNNLTMQNEQKLENIRKSVEERLSSIQTGNEKKLDEMRQTVDEKLQRTLDERLKQSFSLVSERLEQVSKGLGEMQNLAVGVGDLKKVLSNVKTRGILGEIQLGAILEEILAPEQYAANVATVKGSSERVEFAVRLPGDGNGEPVWLPIDAKFPADAYANLLDAYDKGDAAAVELTGAVLERRIRGFAKDIRDKYIHVPDTTDFGIMFLPVEGLYAEVVRRGLVETLQTDYKVNIAGPTTMAALLNSLQMGFRTLAIQKRSSEVWTVLGEVKSEFATFEKVLNQTKRHLELASKDIDTLVGVRTRQIRRKLKDVTSITSGDDVDEISLLDSAEEEPEEDD